MAIAAVNGTELAYDDEGEGGPPFVFIHGWACDRTFWRPQFGDLKRDHRCIAVDLRGRGGSPAKGPFDTTTAADDVAALLRELGLPPAIVVGHSLGGLVALLLNERHPDLVLGVVTGDSPLTKTTGTAWERVTQIIREEGSMSPMAAQVEGFFVEDTPDEVRDQARTVMLSCPAEVGAGMLSNGQVFVERMRELLLAADAKPFMAIWAETPLGEPELLRDVCTFVRQEPIPGSGHFFQLEQPAITNALLRAFLDDVERDPRLGGAG